MQRVNQKTYQSVIVQRTLIGKQCCTVSFAALFPFCFHSPSVNKPLGVVLYPYCGKFPVLKRSPCWIASCQSALWDTFVWAPFFLLLLLPSAPLAASSFGLCADGWGRQTGSRRVFGRAAPLPSPGESIPQPWPRDPGCSTARPGLTALTSQPRETNIQLVHAVQMAPWFNIDGKSMM